MNNWVLINKIQTGTNTFKVMIRKGDTNILTVDIFLEDNEILEFNDKQIITRALETFKNTEFDSDYLLSNLYKNKEDITRIDTNLDIFFNSMLDFIFTMIDANTDSKFKDLVQANFKAHKPTGKFKRGEIWIVNNQLVMFSKDVEILIADQFHNYYGSHFRYLLALKEDKK